MATLPVNYTILMPLARKELTHSGFACLTSKWIMLQVMLLSYIVLYGDLSIYKMEIMYHF